MPAICTLSRRRASGVFMPSRARQEDGVRSCRAPAPGAAVGSSVTWGRLIDNQIISFWKVVPGVCSRPRLHNRPDRAHVCVAMAQEHDDRQRVGDLDPDTPYKISVRVLAIFCWEGASGREICGSRQKQTSRQAKKGHLVNIARLSSNESLSRHVAAWPMPPQIGRRKKGRIYFHLTCIGGAGQAAKGVCVHVCCSPQSDLQPATEVICCSVIHRV